MAGLLQKVAVVPGDFHRPPDATTRTCEFWLVDDYLVARFRSGAAVELDDARENLDTAERLIRGVSIPLMVDLRQLRSQSSEARALLAGPHAKRVSRAVALLIGAPLSRVIGNFYLRFNRPETPTRLFSVEADAREWLRTVAAEAADGRHGE
jgi:hypothetical protein